MTSLGPPKPTPKEKVWAEAAATNERRVARCMTLGDGDFSRTSWRRETIWRREMSSVSYEHEIVWRMPELESRIFST